MIQKTDFIYSEESEPHRIRTKQILKQFPHLRKLIGKNPYTIFAIIGLVTFQVVMAWLVRDQSWWIVIGAAYLLGAFADHALFVMIHECTHQLLFKTKNANRWASMFANMPQIFPSAMMCHKCKRQVDRPCVVGFFGQSKPTVPANIVRPMTMLTLVASRFRETTLRSIAS